MRGHVLLKLMLGSYSCSGRAIPHSLSLTQTLIPPYACLSDESRLVDL